MSDPKPSERAMRAAVTLDGKRVEYLTIERIAEIIDTAAGLAELKARAAERDQWQRAAHSASARAEQAEAKLEELRALDLDSIGDITMLHARATAAEAEVARKFMIDTMGGKLTTFDQVCGYISLCETKLHQAEAERDQLRERLTDAACHELDALRERDAARAKLAAVRATCEELSEINGSAVKNLGAHILALLDGEPVKEAKP